MRKLLRANFARLWKDKIFWCAVIGTFVYSCIVAVNQYQIYLGYRAEGQILQITFSALLLNYFTFLCIVMAAVISQFIGSDYSDGTIRNKLVTGASRTNIYLSNYITCVVSTLIIELAWLFPMAAAGLRICEIESGDLRMLALYFGLGILLIVSETAIFTTVSMLCQNKAATAIALLIVTFGLLIMAVTIYQLLAAPEFYEMFNTETMQMETVRNMDYLTGTKRKIYQFLMDFVPTGQGYLVAAANSSHPALLGVYSAVTAIAAGVVGIFGFRRKDLK